MTTNLIISSDSPPDLDPSVAAALREYLNVLESGIASELLEWQQRNEELMPQLKCYLEGLHLIHELSPPLRKAAREMQEDSEVKPESLGDFRILRRIGRGGMGIVYEAEQISLNRRVAVKILPFAGALDDTMTQRFQREAQAAASLNHPHIVPVLTVGCERGIHFYAMPLIVGNSMAELIKDMQSRIVKDSNRSILPRQVRRPEWFLRVAAFGVQAARSLQFAHDRGIIHRDIKPANLLIDENDQLFVTDFGLASTREMAGLTTSGHMTGTLRYASPEQIHGKRAGVDHRTDVYSLGASLYELATLSQLVPGEDPRALTHCILHQSVKAPRRMNSSVPKDLENVILRAASTERVDRYESADELADDLQRFIDGNPVKARQLSRAVLLARSFLRRPQLVIGTVLLLAGVVGLLTVSTILVNRARQSAEKLQHLAEAQAERLESLQNVTQQQLSKAIEHSQLMQATRYTKSIFLAQQMINESEIGKAEQLLSESVPKSGESDIRGFEWHYLNDQCQSGGQEYPGHEGDVYSLAWSPDGTRVASASQDKSVRVWTLFTEHQGADGEAHEPHPLPGRTPLRNPHVIVLRGHTSEVNFVAFSRDGRRIASASDDGTIRVWDLDNSPVAAAQANAEISGIQDSKSPTVSQHSPPSLEFKGHDNPVVGVAFSPLTGHLVSSDDRGQLIVWDSETGEILSRTQAHPRRVEGLEFTQDGRQIATAGNDSTVGIWDATNLPVLSEKKRLTGPVNAVYGVAWSHDGNKLVAGGWDSKLRIWSQEQGDSFPVFVSTYGEAKSVSFSPDGRLVTYTNLSGDVHQMDATSGLSVGRLHIPEGRCWTAQYSPNGQWLAAAGSGKSLFLWPADPEVRQRGETIPTQSVVSEIFVTEDGQQLVTLEDFSRIRLRSAATGLISFEFPGTFQKQSSIALGEHAEMYAVNAESRIECWDLARSPPLRRDSVLSGTKTLHITSAGNRKFISLYENVPREIASGNPMISPEGQKNVDGLPFVGPDPVCIPVFHFYHGYWWYPHQQKQVPCRYLQFPHLSVFSPDGRSLYTANERVIHELPLGASEPARLPLPNEGEVSDLAISSDGKTLVIANGSSLSFWNLKSHEKAMTIDHPGQSVGAVTFTPDGSTLIYSTSFVDLPAGSQPIGNLRFVRISSFL